MRLNAVVMGVAQYTEWKHALVLLKLLAQGEADIGSKRIVDQAERAGSSTGGWARRARQEGTKALRDSIATPTPGGAFSTARGPRRSS